MSYTYTKTLTQYRLTIAGNCITSNAAGNGGGAYMTKAVYDPDSIGGDVFDPENQKITDMTEIGEALADSDAVVVYNASGTVNRKSLLSRVWTYIKGKADLVYVTGPSSATDNAIARFNTTGKLLQNSGVTIDDNDNVAGVATLAQTRRIQRPRQRQRAPRFGTATTIV